MLILYMHKHIYTNVNHVNNINKNNNNHYYENPSINRLIVFAHVLNLNSGAININDILFLQGL